MSLEAGDIAPLWRVACGDAGFDPEADAQLALIVEGPKDSTHLAVHIEPGSTVTHDSMFPLTKGQLDAFNDPSQRSKHRVAVFTAVTPRVMTGLLRHELEHARQWQSFPAAYARWSLAMSAFAEAGVYAGRPGGSTLYNAVPHEEAANAAASRLLRATGGEPTSQELDSEHAQLFRPADLSWAPDDLPAETLGCLALHPEAVEKIIERSGSDVVGYLAELNPAVEQIWELMRNDDELSEIRSGFAGLVPTDEEIELVGVDRAGRAWKPLLEEIGRGRGRARAIISENGA